MRLEVADEVSVLHEFLVCLGLSHQRRKQHLHDVALVLHRQDDNSGDGDTEGHVLASGSDSNETSKFSLAYQVLLMHLRDKPSISCPLCVCFLDVHQQASIHQSSHRVEHRQHFYFHFHLWQ